MCSLLTAIISKKSKSLPKEVKSKRLLFGTAIVIFVVYAFSTKKEEFCYKQDILIVKLRT